MKTELSRAKKSPIIFVNLAEIIFQMLVEEWAMSGPGPFNHIVARWRGVDGCCNRQRDRNYDPHSGFASDAARYEFKAVVAQKIEGAPGAEAGNPYNA